MLNINIQEDLWTKLQKATKPIYIYGMGDGAIKIMDVCKGYNIPIAGIFASDEYVRGHSFLDFKVLTLKQVEEQCDEFIILLAFAAFEKTLMEKVYSIAEKHELYAPDVPVCGEGLFNMDYYQTNKDSFNWVHSRLADDYSKKVFTQLLQFKLTGNINYLVDISTTRLEDLTQLVKLKDGYGYVDLGAYDGDTIREVMAINPSYGSIYAFEPDSKNYKKLTNNTGHLENCNLYHLGSYSHQTTLAFNNKAGRNSAFSHDGKIEMEVNSVDNIVGENKVDYIKMDVEGAELLTLEGCVNTVKNTMPALGVAAYHRNEDLFALPMMIDKLSTEYKIYLRHNHYIPAWESIFYACR